MAADRLLRCAVAVDRRGIDPVDAGLDRAPQRRDAGHLVGIDQDSAGHAAAECELGNFEPGAAENNLPHQFELSARNLKRWILPVAVLGSSVRNSIQRGYL